MAELFTLPARATDSNGDTLSGAKLFFYATGTTTPQAVYSDATLETPHANPVVADSGGKFASIYMDPSLAYRAVCKSADEVTTLYDIDPANTYQPYTGAIRDLREWDGVDLTGADDCAAILTAALTETAAEGSVLYIPAGTIRLNSVVEVPAGAAMKGPPASYMANANTGRAMFHIAHTGKGFTCTGALGGRSFEGIGTFRTQPALGVAWAPTAHDWDFYVDGATDVSFRDILLLNPTKGIICTNGGGRFSFEKVWGQPLTVGIQIDTSYDVTRIDDVHFWNFWTEGDVNESYAIAHMLANATAIYSKRNDNPDFFDIFAIFYRHGLRIGNWAGSGPGTTSRLRCFGLGLDACGGGITVDADANGFTADIHGFYAHGNDTVITSGNLIDVAGTNGTLRVYGRTDLSNAHRSAIRVTGAGSHVAVEDPLIAVYNMANGGYQAVFSDTGTYGVTIRGDVGISGGVSGAAAYGGSGRIYGKLKRAYVPVVTSSGGAITSYTINSAVYDVLDSEVEAIVDFTITDNGTGATGLLVTLPITSNSGVFDAGIGEETVTGGKVLRVHIPNNSTTCQVTNYDNTYPGATNARIVLRLKYRI